jgi:hypothetical protein
MHNGPFGKRRNSIAVFRAQEAGTQECSVRCLKAYILKTIALNRKIILNLLTYFLRSFQIHKGPTSDIGTLILTRFPQYISYTNPSQLYGSATFLL